MDIKCWFLCAGIFLLAMVLSDKWMKRSPLSPAIIYLLLGFLLGPQVFDLINDDLLENLKTIEIASEIVVIVSLFSAGLKLQIPFKHAHWKISALLASVAMLITVALLAFVGHQFYALPWAAAIMLGGILAPTDPVLASEVQVKHEKDKDRVRTALTGEAGINDGTAFPVIMLGLVLIGARWQKAESPLLTWLAVDLLWAIPAGLAIGYACGWLAAKLVIFIHAKPDEELVIEDFVSLGLIAAAYGVAQVFSTYGFLAVFAAGLAFARVERDHVQKKLKALERPGFTSALSRFTAQLERMGEVVTVIFIGFIASRLNWSIATIALPVILILAVRPLSIFASLAFRIPLKEKLIISWFGIRGIGSVYYLGYALTHGFEKVESAAVVTNLVLATIVISVVAHGLSGSPIMKFYELKAKTH